MSTNHIIEQYIALWNERDSNRRQERASSIFSHDARYTDPVASVEGIAEIDALIAAAQQQLNGLPLELAGSVDAHHDIARFQWQVRHPENGERVIVGFDVARIANGRIVEVLGFLDKAPATA